MAGHLPADSSVRLALLDAAYDAAVAGEWDKVRMADVARAAGVSRQTLYNEFGSKDGLGQALAVRETVRFLEGTGAACRAASDPVDAVERAVRFCLDFAADNPLLKATLAGTGDSTLLPFLTTRGEWTLALGAQELGSQVLARWPDLDRQGVGSAAEVVVRLVVSHLMYPTARPEQTAAAVARLVAPALVKESR